jgi:hypothetical protein
VQLSHEDIETIAHRVVELLRERSWLGGEPAGSLVGAATLARLLGVTRATVYANADQLGAIRLGAGKRARLRFDPSRLVARNGAREPAPTRPGRSTNGMPRPAGSSPVAAPLLPIRSGRGEAGRRQPGGRGRS